MPAIIVVGIQWGDEGKGKVVDLLSSQASHVVRSQGGDNAGHTVQVGTREYAFHLIPSGILHSNSHCYVASGCLVNPKNFSEEIKRTESMGVALSHRLHVSPHAHVIFPFHQELDKLYEERKKGGAIGTTGRGIGPCSADRVSRIGIRISELLRPEIFKEKLETLASYKNLELEKIFGKKPIDTEFIYQEYTKYGEILRPFVSDVEGKIHKALLRDETILFEGAHGTMLDPIFGSYPFVTSSSCLASGVAAGAGVGPMKIDDVIGVLKAYTTRVGEGPLPTSCNPDEMQDFQRKENLREEGTTTGRKRRIGWLDLVLARYAAELNGVNNLVLTKLDVLDRLEEIKICTNYTLDGELIDKPPPLAEDLARVEPSYEVIPGWQSSTKGAKSIRHLPKNARKFIERIEEFCNLPIMTISVGPNREETIQVDEEWM